MHEPETDQPPEAESRERKPYTAPRIEESARFEHLAITCAMTEGGGPMCAMGMARSMAD